MQAALLRAYLYRKLAILNRSRLCLIAMEIIEKLLSHAEWKRFLDYKREGGHLSAAEEENLTKCIENKAYLPAAQRLNNGGFFALPKAVQVNKASSGKKRTVFVFEESEKLLQKFIAFCLLDYDGIFADNCYAFRRHTGVKKAVAALMFDKEIDGMYAYKLDIADYFNSVEPTLLLPMLQRAIPSEKKLYRILEEMLLNPYALVDGEQRTMRKGILAGSPVSGFMANLFLTELDKHFAHINAKYARYSDDIIVFAKTQEALQEHIDYMQRFLEEHKLSVNPKKVALTAPGEKWTFLGFSYHRGCIDISPVSKQKMKKKMRRKARALHRWQQNKGVPPERAARAFVKYFDKKLYHNPVNNEITWSRWYFPIINTGDSLRELDGYTQQCLRYIATGKRNSAQFRFTYHEMKALGYTTLVNRFYRFKQQKWMH